MLALEKKAKKDGYSLVIGLDEAGRGPLAGPVVASAVSLKQFKFSAKIADSKVLNARQREEAFEEIFDKAYVGVGVISEAVIDEINILEATYVAMHNAVTHLLAKRTQSPEHGSNIPSEKICLFIDGNRFKTDLPYHYRTVVRADQSVMSVACASIVAKVVRDSILKTYDQIFPGYGFKQHKGYPTDGHKIALKRLGPSLIHRRSFHPNFV